MLRIRILFWICPSCAKNGILAPESVYVSFKIPAKSFLNHLLLTVDGKYHKAAVHSIKIIRKESQSLTMLTFLIQWFATSERKNYVWICFFNPTIFHWTLRLQFWQQCRKIIVEDAKFSAQGLQKNLISPKLPSICFLKFIVRTSSMLFWHPCRNTVVQRPKNIPKIL